MITVLGGMTGGIGMLFFGMWLLSENLKTVAGPRIRMLVSQYTTNRFASFGCGVLAGAITQSSVAVTSITVSMLKSELVSPRQGFLIVTGSPLGVTLLILVVAFDIRAVALFALGAAGVIIFRARKAHYREIGSMLFGVALLVLGLVIIKESATPLADESWFQGALEISTRSLWLSLIIGAVLTFILQAGLPILAFGMVMAAAGLIEFEQILMFVYGVFTGLGAAILLVGANVSGTARRVAMFSAVQNFFPALILIPLLYVELYLDVPLVKAALVSTDMAMASQVALMIILYGTPSRIVVLAAPDWTARLFARFWPVSETEELSRPKYIHDRALTDVDTSLDLVHLEQKRVLGMFSSYLDAARTRQIAGAARQSVGELNSRINEFLAELELRNPSHSIERRNAVLSRQKLITWLEEQFSNLNDRLREIPEEPPLGDFHSLLVEGTDSALFVFLNALESEDQDDWELAWQVMGDRRELMQRVRSQYMQEVHETVRGQHSRSIVGSTNSVENIFFLLTQLTREYQQGELSWHIQDSMSRGGPTGAGNG